MSHREKSATYAEYHAFAERERLRCAECDRLRAQLATLRDAAEKAARFCNGAGWYRPAGMLEKALGRVG